MWVGGVVEYICQTLGTGVVTILRISMGWWCCEVHVRCLRLVLVVLLFK